MGWTNYGQARPPFAVVPGPGQESVWDYPRPPRLERDSRQVLVRCGEVVIAETNRALRILETASPPTFYIPREDVVVELLEAAPGGSHCEWKGSASYWHVQLFGARVESAGWSYARPHPDYAELNGAFSFYPAKVDCFVDGEAVQPQPGGFYGGWMTREIVGPVKGAPGSGGW